MSEQEQKILDDFRKLTPENQTIAQSNVSVALATQENTMKSMGKIAAQEKPRKRKTA